MTDRVVDFVSSADDEVVYVTAEELLTDEVVDCLSTVSDRRVSIQLAEMSQSAEARLEREIPDAQLFEWLWDWSDTPAGRLLMVDQEKTLVSVLVDANGAYPLEPRDETAIWGAVQTNSLVVVLKGLYTWQLDTNRDSHGGR
ncbi:hypothetical protein [Halobaculum gomorrense]|uniref:hypothetical protein n=1 Tax=Halobaculum gomorrense TaxID=43928 RepID=UPI002AA2ABAD|nr:hypothetical protein [Halobaculum gomorrense]